MVERLCLVHEDGEVKMKPHAMGAFVHYFEVAKLERDVETIRSSVYVSLPLNYLRAADACEAFGLDYNKFCAAMRYTIGIGS